MSLAGQWNEIFVGLAEGWGEARIQLTVEQEAETDRAAALLGPLEPFRAGSAALTIRVARDGNGPSAETVKRTLARLDGERLRGTISLLSSAARLSVVAVPPAPTLAESWDAALATLPADWSDLLGEIELSSSDYINRGALLLAPINPRRVGERMAFRFRSASRFGYGASAGMVRRCLERCDNEGIQGSMAVLRALSDTRPVGTQGPVWQIDGEMV